MGIPLFVGGLIRRNFDVFSRQKPNRITTLCLDFANILHQVVARLNVEKEKWDFDRDYFPRLEELLIDLIKMIAPQLRLVIAIDGVAPLGKINQQRKRRFKTALERASNNSQKFDSNAISPGTEVSLKVDLYMRSFIDKYQSILPPNIIFSGHLVPGEGEHKIVEEIKQITGKHETIVILGSDADLVLLTLPFAEERIFLYQDNFWTDEQKVDELMNRGASRFRAEQGSIREKKEFIDVSLLRTLLEKRKIGINEFIMASTLFGNDFLPPCPGFNLILDVQETFLQALEGRVFAKPFQLDRFFEFLHELEPVQLELFEKLKGKIPLKNGKKIKYPCRAQNFEEWNDQITFAKMIPDGKSLSTKDGTVIDFPENGPEIELEFQARRYLMTLIWNFHYYRDHRSVDWDWVYYPYWSPPIQELLNIDRQKFLEKGIPTVLHRRAPLHILEQMLLILPRDLQSGLPNELLPKSLQPYQDENSNIFDFYPFRFLIIKDGITSDYEARAYLPPFDLKRFKQIFDLESLTKKERESYKQESPRRIEPVLVPASQHLYKYQEEKEELLADATFINDNYRRQIANLFGIEILGTISDEKDRLFLQLEPFPNISISFQPLEVKVRTEKLS